MVAWPPHGLSAVPRPASPAGCADALRQPPGDRLGLRRFGPILGGHVMTAEWVASQPATQRLPRATAIVVFGPDSGPGWLHVIASTRWYGLAISFASAVGSLSGDQRAGSARAAGQVTVSCWPSSPRELCGLAASRRRRPGVWGVRPRRRSAWSGSGPPFRLERWSAPAAGLAVHARLAAGDRAVPADGPAAVPRRPPAGPALAVADLGYCGGSPVVRAHVRRCPASQTFGSHSLTPYLALPSYDRLGAVWAATNIALAAILASYPRIAR